MIRRLSYSNPSSKLPGAVTLSPQPGYTWLVRELVVITTTTSGAGTRYLSAMINRGALLTAIITSSALVFFNVSLGASASNGWYIGPVPGATLLNVTATNTALLQTPICLSSLDSLTISPSSYLVGDALYWAAIIEEVLD